MTEKEFLEAEVEVRAAIEACFNTLPRDLIIKAIFGFSIAEKQNKAA